MAMLSLNKPVLSIPSPETITRVQLDNGIVVLVYENHSAQSVVITGAIDAGSLYEPLSHNGLANMTAAALMMGTDTRDFEAIHSSLEDIGADLGVTAGHHKAGFSGKSLAEDLPVLIGVLADVLRQPTFPENHIERLRGEALTWLGYRQQDTRWQAGRLFREHLYPADHPYHYGVRGTYESMPLLTIDALRDYHAQVYGPRGMTIVVVGAVEADQAVQIVADSLGDWRNPHQPQRIDVGQLSPRLMGAQAGFHVPGKTQSDLIIGAIGPSRFEPDFQAANLANSILGQFGMMGRIGSVVREEAGLAYYAYSRVDGGYGPGAWSISAGVNPANVDYAIELCVGEITRLASEPVGEDDLADNQSYYTGRLPLQLESNEGLAGSILSMENYGLGLDYLVRYHDMIYSLTRDDLLAAAQKYLRPEALVIAVAGPGAG